MRKNILMFILGLLMVVGMASIVDAGVSNYVCTINSPITSGDIRSGNYSVNFTASGGNLTGEITGFGFNVTPADGTEYVGKFEVNGSANQSTINFSFPNDNTNAFPDGQVQITIRAYSTGANVSACSSTRQFVIDNLDISGAYDSGSPADNTFVRTSGGGNFSVSSTTSEEILEAFLLVGSQDRFRMANSSLNRSIVSYSPTSLQAPERTYDTRVQIADTDGTTTSTLATRYVTFDYSTSAGGSAIPFLAKISAQKLKTENLFFWIVLLAGIWYVYSSKKRR